MILMSRLGGHITLDCWEYGQPRKLNDAWVSMHPAGHILGSSQIRIEVDGKVAVVTGDYKRERDPTCVPFECVECDLLVTESTFGLPIFQWPRFSNVMDDIHTWWRHNQSQGKTSILLAYAAGKAQRLLSSLDPSIGPIVLHGAIKYPTEAYRASGITFPPYRTVSEFQTKMDWSPCLVLAVPGAQGTPWIRRFGDVSIAMASGWMAVRGMKRRRGVDRGFVVSDHVDWHGLIRTIEESKASSVWVTHGFSNIVSRYLKEQGKHAQPLETQFLGELEQDSEPGNPEESSQ